ncbi:MAG TPA: KH domain-containing protein [Candidatus Acidoferrales bacterium]|nr:KH domain-containing protein [Candidatus Acidoferrales bacterium]
MSAFDDEFGLFSEGSDDVERRPTLGARKIASQETVIDEIELEEEKPARRAVRQPRPPRRERDYGRRPSGPRSGDPWAGHRRASDLLGFMARKLVAKPDAVEVELFMDEEAKPVIELVVDPDDLGKVIGRSGRVAHALRTIVRATAEGRVSIDILDTNEAAEGSEENEDDAG